jgi:hypothetical protein
VRLVAAVAGLVAIVVTTRSAAAAGTFRFFDFFGYFTIQSNAIFAGVLGLAAVTAIAGRRAGPALSFARGAATTYMVIVGLVYNALLTGADVGVLVPWANAILHVVLPIYAVIDWVLVADRTPLAWRWLPLVLVYPILWVAVVLGRQVIEGAGGWVPYPFLNIGRIGAEVWGWVALIAACFVVVSAVVWWASRARVLRA